MSGGWRYTIPSRENRQACLFSRFLPSRYQAVPLVLAVESLNLKSTTMTTMYALDGPWTGLTALGQPRHAITSPERLRAALDRIGDLHDELCLRIDLLMRAADRCNGLRSALIDQLDALDADEAECEPVGDDEPSLTAVMRWDQTFFGVGDQMSDEDLEAQEEGGGEDEDRENDWRRAPAAVYADAHNQTLLRHGDAIFPAG